MTEERYTKRVYILEQDDSLYKDLTFFIEELKRLLDSIPTEYQSTAIISIDSEGNLNISYLRPENDEEFSARLQIIETKNQQKIEVEREILKQLKAKYES